MAKNIYNDNSLLGKSLYNLQPGVKLDQSSLGSYLTNYISTVDLVVTDGNSPDFSSVSSNSLKSNVVESTNVTVGGLSIIQANQQIVNNSIIQNTMITTSLYSSTGELATGYSVITLDVPYIYNEPDHILDSSKNEGPENFLEVKNSKFKVTGPFTFIKSIKTSIKTPTITLGYYDREESTYSKSTTLDLTTYDKGIVMERVENNNKTLDGIKFSYIGYSQNLDRFVMYKDGVYIGTDEYFYSNMDGSLNTKKGILNEYNIGRNPNTIGVMEGTSTLEVDAIYTNDIFASDHTNSRSLNLYSYDTMSINVNRANGDTNQNRNFDLHLNVGGRIIVSSEGQGTVQTSGADYIIESTTGTFINAYNPAKPTYMEVPVKIGYKSLVNVDNYLQTTYISSGVDTRNKDTMIEFGGNFTASEGIDAGSVVLIDNSITGHSDNDIHGIYSRPTINVPNNNAINNVSNLTLSAPILNLGSGSSVGTSSTIHVTGSTSNATNNYSILSSQGEVRFLGNQSSGAYMGWSDNTLNLYNSRLYINSEQSNLPILSFGKTGSFTKFYNIQRMNVDGVNELYVDGISLRILLEDNTSYTITGTIMAVQGSNTCASYKVEYCLSIRNGIKNEKCYKLNVLTCDVDVDDNEIFDLIIGYSGDESNFVIGDAFIVTGSNTNNTNTNWYGLLEITMLEKP